MLIRQTTLFLLLTIRKKRPIKIRSRQKEVTNVVRSEEMIVQFNNVDRIFIGRKTQYDTRTK